MNRLRLFPLEIIFSLRFKVRFKKVLFVLFEPLEPLWLIKKYRFGVFLASLRLEHSGREYKNTVLEYRSGTSKFVILCSVICGSHVLA